MKDLGSSLEGGSRPPCSILHPPSPGSLSFPLTSPNDAPAPAPAAAIHNVIGRHGSQPPYRKNRHNQHQNQNQNNPILESVQSAFDSIRQHLKSDGTIPKDHILPAFLSGTLAFYATACSSQFVQHKFLKMSTGTRPAFLPITLGAATVALGSWMGHLAGLGAAASWGAVRDSRREGKLFESAPRIGRIAMRPAEEMARPMTTLLFAENPSGGERREGKEVWMHAARICILGLLTYKTIFRSNFSSISPSSYTARGSFARMGIPAPPNFNYATRSQRETIERVGKWWGCHTCGSRMMFSNLKKNAPKFHGDHIPPVSVAKQLNNRWYRKPFGRKVSQKFYPQCRNCSNTQGGLLSKAVNSGHKNLHSVGGGEQSYFHGRRIRIGHMAGGAVAILSIGNDGSTADGNVSELVEASRRRVLSFQVWIEDLGRDLKGRVESLWRNFP